MGTHNNDKYITLKEAAHISGYAPDYIGQLIRSGKIDGKQVYSNVAWVTTEDSVLSYKNRAKGKKRTTSDDQSSASVLSAVALLEKPVGKRLIKGMSYVLVGVGSVFALFTFYLLSIAVDHRLELRSIERAEAWAETVPLLTVDEDPQIPL